MPEELTLIKKIDGSFVPVTEADIETASGFKLGQAIKISAVQHSARSLRHHKLFFGGLIQIAMDHWEPTGGLLQPSEKAIVKRFVKYVESVTGQKGSLTGALQAFLEHVQDERRDKYQATHKDSSDFLEWLKLEAGHFDWIDTPRGLIRKTRSINFNSMGQEEFNEFYKKCFSVVWRFLLQQTYKDEAEAQNVINQMASMG